MSTVTVRAFGPLGARVAGGEAELGGPRQRAVLGMLVAASGRVVSVDRFLEDLWSGEPPPKALGALQAYVSHLRRLLEPDRAPRTPASVLVSAPPGYALALPVPQVDTWAFDALVRAAEQAAVPAEVWAACTRALALWTDEPFTGYPDQEWAVAEAGRLRERRATAVELRAGAALALGRPEAVLGDLAALHARDPLRERTAGLRALALYRVGRQGEALTVLRETRTRLVDELGVDPGPELRALESDILAQAPHLLPAAAPAAAPAGAPAAAPAGAHPRPVQEPTDPPAPGSAPPGHPGSAPPGRPGSAPPGRPGSQPPDDPGSASPGRPGSAPPGRPGSVPPGHPGSVLLGRAAELAALHRAAAATGPRPSVAWVEGEPGVGKSALVERFAAGLDGWTVARGRCPEVSGAPPGWAWSEIHTALTGTAATGPAFDLARAVAGALTGPVLLLLEDLHRADQETLQILRQLATADGPAEVLVVGTFRGDEAGPDLRATLAATVDRTAGRIALTGLDDDAARTLLHGVVGRDLPESAWGALLARASGNALFLRQLGGLVAAEGVGAAATGLPVAIRELIGRRLDRLPARTATTLARAAVLGRDVDVDLLLAVTNTPEDDLVDDLDAGVVAGLLTAPDPASVRFVHALVRDTCYDRIPPIRRGRLHLAVVEALEGRPDQVFALAHHSAQSLTAGSAARALPHLVRGAEQARRGGAADEAAGYWRAALAAHDLGAGDTPGLLRAHRGLVEAVAASGDALRARAEREASLAAAERLGDTADVARAWIIDSPTLWTARPFDLADSDAVAARITAVLDRLDPADRALRADLLATRSQETEAWLLGVSAPSSEEALDLARELDDPRLLCRALNSRFAHTFASDDVDELAVVADALLAAADRAGRVDFEALAHLLHASHAIGCADLPAVDRHLHAAVRAGTTGQLAMLLFATQVYGATELLLSGDLEQGRARHAEVLARIIEGGEPNAAIVRVWATGVVEFTVGSLAGMVDDIRAVAARHPGAVDDVLTVALLDAGLVDEARAGWDRPPWPRDATWLVATSLRAHCAARLGDLAECRRTHDALLPWSGRLARTLNGLVVLGPVDLFLAETAAALGDTDAAARHADRALALGTRFAGDPWRPRATRLQVGRNTPG
ncbi:BTAD domain-containing putative transcriptional regulator [Pseudonocardia oroxyli]|uniref:DNA-binding transcriptional activator of the SARP family n=1 Tax=Pseudonocardia oroxyli TaxID=366584 RepID=A0A1G7DZ73_PSEOR|nr:BTAD domain-containing putative transcriptional regulator [Pseudonocardia oroxyli]SDE56724.1 DNA-binding transcriptional activator of the SARP family [Pseudonocardia oroxyli]